MVPSFQSSGIEKSKKRKRAGRFLFLLTVLLLASVSAIASQEANLPVGGRGGDVVAWSRAAWNVALASVGESPGTEPEPWNGEINFCDPLSQSKTRAFEDAVALMRSTASGRDLFDLLQDEGVCIGIEDLTYNSAYATARWSIANGWADSEIRIDPSFVTFLYPDVLAAILVHEATHIERAISHSACYYADTCTVLPNGVYLDEEVMAHTAEAEFWVALYGRDGKDRAVARDHLENQLKAYYLQGPAAFERYVSEMRSDAREGEGIE